MQATYKSQVRQKARKAMIWIARTKLVALIVSVLLASIFVFFITWMSLIEWVITGKTRLLQFSSSVVQWYMKIIE